MRFRSKWMFLIFMVIIAVAACSSPLPESPLVSNTPPPSQQSGNHRKLFVFLSGFTSLLSTTEAAGNNGYGSDPDFFGPGLIQPFLQTKFPGSYFLMYSYSGFSTEGKPSPYVCALTIDNDIADLAVGLYNQISQFLRSHSNTPNIDIYIIGHSLGGVITFAFLSQMVSGNHNMLDSFPDGGALKGVFTLDSPIGGVADNWFYTLFGARYAVMKANCNGANLLTLPVVGELNDLYNSTASPESQGATASVNATITRLNQENNQTVALEAMQDGLTVSTFGNTTDVLWQPGLCNNNFVDFLSTQWIQEVQSGRNQQNGAVYARTLTAGTLDCNALSNNSDAGNHFAVLTDSNVQTAIWQVIVGQDPNALMSVPVIPTPTTTPVPAPTPIPSPTVTATSTPVSTVTTTPTATATPGSYPNLAASYQGTIHNTTYNIQTTFALASIVQNQGNIDGSVIIGPGLYGTGPFTGTIGTDGNVNFTDNPTDGASTILFTGLLNADGSLSGTYSVPSTGEQGTWQTTSSPSGSTLSSGIWQGQGTYNNGQSPFDMLLALIVNGNTFTGTLTEDTYNSEVAINGSIIGSSGNGIGITFTDPSTISGSQIALNCTYTVTISNGQMNGVWYYSGDSAEDGSLTLNKTA